MEIKESVKVELKINKKIEELKLLANSVKDSPEKEIEKIINYVDEQLANITEKKLIEASSFWLRYHQTKRKDYSCINDLFTFNIEESLLNICNEILYEKITSFIKEKIENLSDLKILEIAEMILGLNVILESERLKYILDGGEIENTTILNKEKTNNLKNEIILFIKSNIKFELKLINEEKFHETKSYIYFKILRFKEVKEINDLLNFSEDEIEYLGHTKENMGKIKKEIKIWLEKNEEVKKMKSRFINENSLNMAKSIFYLFDEEEIELYKSVYIKNLERKIKTLHEEIESSDFYFHKSIEEKIENIIKQYEKIKSI